MSYTIDFLPPDLHKAPSALIGLVHRFEQDSNYSINRMVADVATIIQNSDSTPEVVSEESAEDPSKVRVPFFHPDTIQQDSSLVLNLFSSATASEVAVGEVTFGDDCFDDEKTSDEINHYADVVTLMDSLPLNWFSVAIGIDVDHNTTKVLESMQISVKNGAIYQLLPGYIASGGISTFLHRSSAYRSPSPSKKTLIRWYS